MKGRRMIKTNRDILGELRRHGITVTALAESLGLNRTTLSMRLNQRDKPDPEFLAEVREKIEELKR